jgi:hypothetical protein
MKIVKGKTITKEDFDKAYNQYLPGQWIKIAFKYFSKDTEMRDMKPKKILIGILLGLFIIGYTGTVLNLSRNIIGPATYTYGGILGLLILYLFSAVFLNNNRIRKIRKILGITKMEYNSLVDRFYPSPLNY